MPLLIHKQWAEGEGGTSHPGMYKHRLQNDGRTDGRNGVRVGTWNLGSLGGNGGETCEELREDD